MIFVLSQQAAASACSGSTRACNLIFLRKPPLCGLGMVGGLAELCHGILSFCNILECDEILTCRPDCVLLHTFEDFFFFVSELCLGRSLVAFSFRQLQSERAAALCPPACIVYGGYRCPLKKARVSDTNRTKQSRTVRFCLCVRLPFSLVLLNSCRIQVLVICICGAS